MYLAKAQNCLNRNQSIHDHPPLWATYSMFDYGTCRNVMYIVCSSPFGMYDLHPLHLSLCNMLQFHPSTNTLSINGLCPFTIFHPESRVFCAAASSFLSLIFFYEIHGIRLPTPIMTDCSITSTVVNLLVKSGPAEQAGEIR